MSKLTKCMIVDDEPLAIQLLTAHIQQMPELKLVATAENPIDAIRLLKEHAIDLLFLDIQMPVLTGIELVRTLKNPPGIIFTTAYREYAVESYELDVVDYLMKPITFIRFLKAVNKFVNQEQSVVAPILSNELTDTSLSDSIYVNVNKKYIKVNFAEIHYVESVKDYIHIHKADETVITKDKISEFAEKLTNDFIRIHRSFIVNRQMITAFTSHDVEIGAKEIPIGGSYKDEVLGKLKVGPKSNI